MSVLTPGTQVFTIVPDLENPGAKVVLEIKNVNALNPGGSPAEQIETTTLADKVRTYAKGLRTPGQATLSIQANPAEPSHVRLHQLSEADGDTTVTWLVAWPDGAGVPSIDELDGSLELPTTRTFFEFDGWVMDFPFDFALNATVATNVTIQRTGGSTWHRKAAA
jgi:hypothetical protein